MRSYIPPATAPNPQRPYRLGDVIVGTVALIGIPTAIATARKIFGRE